MRNAKTAGKLISLYWKNGAWMARVDMGGYYKTIRFLFYSKMNVIERLRDEYNISVSHDFY